MRDQIFGEVQGDLVRLRPMSDIFEVGCQFCLILQQSVVDLMGKFVLFITLSFFHR